MARFSTVFFDWDGTVCNTKEGIYNSVRYAARQFDLPDRTDEELDYFIGPPLYDGFEHVYGVSPELASDLVDTYRVYYTDRGIYESVLYEGIGDVVHSLRAAGIQTAVVSSKPQEYLDRLVEHFDLTDAFDYVLGPEMNNHVSNKAVLVRNALKTLGAAPETSAMVGDRRYDMEGAKDAGVTAVGILFGFGSKEELNASGADVLCETVGDLKRYLLS